MKKHIWLILLGALLPHNVTYAVKKMISPVDRKKLYKCDFCERSYSLPFSCRSHEATHTNEGDFICDQDGCDEHFTFEKDLKNHKIKVHKTGLLVCNICTKKYGRADALTNHQKKHFQDSLFFCKICHLFLTTNRALTRHTNDTDHSKIFDRRSVAEPSAADTLTQPHETALGLSDTDLAGLVELVTNSEKPGDFFLTDLSINFDTNFMEPNTGGTNPSNTVTTNNSGQQQIEQTQTLEGYTIITDEEFAALRQSIEAQRKRD